MPSTCCMKYAISLTMRGSIQGHFSLYNRHVEQNLERCKEKVGKLSFLSKVVQHKGQAH